jgi:hypothetical protein
MIPRFIQTSFILSSKPRYWQRRLSNQPTMSSGAPPKSAFELDDAPLFSLRTRILIFTTFGSAAITSALSYWLNASSENAYYAQDVFPSFITYFGGHLGLPVDPKTGELDRNVLGPRDIRDLVGEKVNLDVQLKNGVKFVSYNNMKKRSTSTNETTIIQKVEADSLESLNQVLNRTVSGGVQQVIPDSIRVAK